MILERQGAREQWGDLFWESVGIRGKKQQKQKQNWRLKLNIDFINFDLDYLEPCIPATEIGKLFKILCMDIRIL